MRLGNVLRVYLFFWVAQAAQFVVAAATQTTLATYRTDAHPESVKTNYKTRREVTKCEGNKRVRESVTEGETDTKSCFRRHVPVVGL